MNKVILKKGRETLVSMRHHWIFSGAIDTFPDTFENGTILPFFDADEKLLGYAYFNKKTSLCGRILSFGDKPYLQTIEENILKAFALRQSVINNTTNAYRIIHAEADFLPGLIVDKYGDYLVIQIGTLGMEKLKPFLISQLSKLFDVKGIYEKSASSSRKEEGLQPFEGTLFGEVPDSIVIDENGMKFLVPLKKGQKTGFFLDQKEMRRLIGSLSSDKKILNAFSYTGGFTVAALKNNALSVESLDTSKEAHEIAQKNVLLNELPLEKCHFQTTDVFDFLRAKTSLDYDLIILDPPAFAKRKHDIDQALRGYKEINSQTMAKMKPNTLLFTFSCSYYIDEQAFRKMLFQSAKKANRNVKILSSHHQSFDHPTNIYHRETDYLKGFLLYVS